MTRCPTIRGRCHAFLDGELPASEADAVRAHLEACEPCRAAFGRERAFLEAVAEGGRETAPPELRRRVEAMLESAGGTARALPGPGWRAWALVAAAAVVALLLVARPWGGIDRPSGAPPAGAPFAADHAAHAARAPSAAPFAPGAAPAPPLEAAEMQGLSRCVVDGRAWAHFTYRAEGATISVFVPLDDAPLPAAGETAGGRGAAPAAVVVVAGSGGRPPAVLVSEGLSDLDLRRVWSRG